MLHFFNMLPKLENEILCNLYSKKHEQMFAFCVKICYNNIESNYILAQTKKWEQLYGEMYYERIDRKRKISI